MAERLLCVEMEQVGVTVERVVTGVGLEALRDRREATCLIT